MTRASMLWCRMGWVVHAIVGLTLIGIAVVRRDLPAGALGALVIGWAYPAYRRSCALRLPAEGSLDGSPEPPQRDHLPG